MLSVATAALVAGGVATTRALAQEPPDVAGFTIFGGPVTSDASPAPDDAGPDPAAGLGTAPATIPARVITRKPAAEPTAEPTAEPAVEPGPIKAVAPKKNYGFAAAADPIAASHTEVTVESISSSPYAPVQQQILALVNLQRGRAGCRPVTIDRRLIDAANGHAAEMARRDYFDHASPNGKGAGDRVSANGYPWRLYGENIARGQRSPWEAMDAWMNSPEHRANILDCKLDQMGVGLAIDGGHTPYWVQDFASPQ
ncbi:MULTISPECIES: CAP domain-containing protein [unclassified Actinoplanes]|uniref:CAP domain-containing protein n=1 Tax=unclassified Actinoplanes TaxID=2626549 RepID=UPI0006935BE9|nr:MULTISPECIES: CAP domain-containing protein [unclassified Actinoplanes]